MNLGLQNFKKRLCQSQLSNVIKKFGEREDNIARAYHSLYRSLTDLASSNFFSRVRPAKSAHRRSSDRPPRECPIQYTNIRPLLHSQIACPKWRWPDRNAQLLHLTTNDNRGGYVGELGMGSRISVPYILPSPFPLPHRYSTGAGCPYRPFGVW